MAILTALLSLSKLLINLEKQRNFLLPGYIIFHRLVNYFNFLTFSITIDTVS